VSEALKSDEAKASYAAQGFDLLGGGPQEFAHAIASDTALADRGAGGGAEEVARRRLVARFLALADCDVTSLSRRDGANSRATRRNGSHHAKVAALAVVFARACHAVAAILPRIAG